ncbi:MAG: hypothetical protein FK732_09515 [Asgard group archaeon]|nr:hypothetical protein [Asgard group archaeon]
MRSKTMKLSIALFISLLFVMTSVSTADIKGSTLDPYSIDLEAHRIYGSSRYVESIDIHPMKSTAVGVNMDLLGGITTLPFDLSPYVELLGFQLVVSKQKLWRQHSQRRFWDVPDGATMLLVFQGMDLAEARPAAASIKRTIEGIYGFNLHLIFGEWNNSNQVAMFVYHGRVSEGAYASFIDNYVSYVPDTGFGKGLTSSVLVQSPVTAMSIGVLHTRFPALGLFTEWIPMLSAAWIDPDGLDKTGSIVDMDLSNIMPSLSPVEGSPYADASIITMKLPYVVDVLEIDPRTDNMYPHLKGYFEWIVKMDLPLFNISIDHSYSDIHVKYDFNLTNLQYYPQVIGEMTLASDLPILEGDDLMYNFTFENVGNEPAYDIEVVYGEFVKNETLGVQLPFAKAGLTFDINKVMYYNTDTDLLNDTVASGSEIITIEGWFFNTTAGDWVGNNQFFTDEEMDKIDELLLKNETYLELDPMDFSTFDLADDKIGLNATIPVLNPGENITLSFAVKNFPSDTEYIYLPIPTTDTNIQVVNMTIVDYLQILGSTLHFPEDQQTWTHLFLEPIMGTAFVYEDADGTEFMGITNGLVIQLYDDEAILVGKVTLDKDVYRFGENATFTLELTNIGDADATNVNYSFGHAFLTDEFDLAYVELIPGSEGVIPNIAPDETVVRQHEQPVITHVGFHPVFAIFNYTSDEADHPEYDIFGSVGHPAVTSSMDFGIVLPPPAKELNHEPTYPTPEVEVDLEILGYTPNETKKGDELLIRYTITNVGDEDTNIIMLQRFPIDEDTDQMLLKPTTQADQVNITIDGVAVTDYSVTFVPLEDVPIGMPFAVLAEDVDWRRNDVYGVPLAVDETLIVEFNVEVNTGGEFYLPPAEVRFRSEHELPETNAINEEGNSAPISDEATAIDNFATACGIENILESTILPNDQPIDTGQSSTNSWGSYSDSLSLLFQQLAGINMNFIYIGIGVIAVTGVAVLIYFTANGKRR